MERAAEFHGQKTGRRIAWIVIVILMHIPSFEPASSSQ